MVEGTIILYARPSFRGQEQAEATAHVEDEGQQRPPNVCIGGGRVANMPPPVPCLRRRGVKFGNTLLPVREM